MKHRSIIPIVISAVLFSAVFALMDSYGERPNTVQSGLMAEVMIPAIFRQTDRLGVCPAPQFKRRQIKCVDVCRISYTVTLETSASQGELDSFLQTHPATAELAVTSHQIIDGEQGLCRTVDVVCDIDIWGYLP